MMLYVSLIVGALLIGLILWVLHRPDNACLCHVICLDDAATEQQIKTCLRRQRSRKLSGKLLFVDVGLSPESVMTAQLLLARETEAILCAPDQALEYVKWEIDHFGAGTD